MANQTTDTALVASLVNGAFTGKGTTLTADDASKLVALLMHARRVARRCEGPAVDDLCRALMPFEGERKVIDTDD